MRLRYIIAGIIIEHLRVIGGADQTVPGAIRLADELKELAESGPLGRASPSTRNLWLYIDRLSDDVTRAIKEIAASNPSS